MATINVDTIKLRECGKEILSLTNEFNENINELFDRIVRIPTNTHEWVGTSAISFAQKANVEKLEYIRIKNTLNNYGNYLIKTADELDKSVNNNRYGG